MGYLSQKKSRKKRDIVLGGLLAVFGLVTCAAFFDDIKHPLVMLIDEYRLQVYWATALMTVVAFYSGKILHSLIFVVLVIMNYSMISTSANIMFSQKVQGGEKVDIIYKMTDNNSETDIKKTPMRRGIIHLLPHMSVNYQLISCSGNELFVVDVNFRELEKSEYKTALNNLAEFVNRQDSPILIVGNFGEPVWTDTFSGFLAKTDLKVKNRIIYTDGFYKFNPLVKPTINLLGYKNIGINKIRILDTDEGSDSYPILFDISVK